MNNHLFFRHRGVCLWVLCSMLISCGGVFANGSTAKRHHRVKASRVSHQKKMSQAPSSLPVVHLNTATSDELMKLKGMNRRRASEIVKYRQVHDAFKRIDDLLKVKGISHTTYRRLLKLNADHLQL